MRVDSANACLTTLALALACFTANAAAVTDWHTFRAAPATTLSGQGTDDPIVGSFTETADASFVIGYAPSPVTLSNIGDRVTFDFSVRFNDTSGMISAADNFRFGIYDLNGESRVTANNTAEAGNADTNDFLGYWFGVKASASGAQGSMRRRHDTTQLNPFANAGATLLGTAGGSVVPLVSSINGDGSGPIYTGTMTLELQPGVLVGSGSFTGNGGMNTFSFTDGSPVTLTYGAVGFLIGNGLDVEEVSFQNVSLVFIPEPAAVLIFALGGVWIFRRRSCAGRRTAA